MRILVVGAGSTGGYFGGRLAQAGRAVTFLVRPARAARLRAEGLQIVSSQGDATVTPQLVTADALDGAYDLVLLSVKAYTLGAAMEDMTKAVGPETMILPVLNGMRHIDELIERFGRPAVLGGLCRVHATLDAQGRIVQMGKIQDLVYGELDGAATTRIRALDAVLQGAGFDARLSMNIELDMWEKWTMLASLAGITCLMRGTIGEIEAAHGGSAFALRFVDEVSRVVQAVGQPPRPALLETVRAMMTQKGAASTASMYRDLIQGAAVEADQILGDLLSRGERAGIDTPLLAAAYAQLCVYQNRLKA
ncbi:MAG TPA: 2-dehydropantoate 2-reductase [Acidocella sp.]|jgi:2-dehydropantoate 2-reductase|uniref:2-dehydropantoate 2-reductase n=1 Tax=Acidocella sp. TaxID=50710 RepID=UPI002D162822|nr:2-dehydropantoate 2-reductase [Acidocella sp.]HVE21960.1 2-dehydropantoate 2-reductase [Acidocella sp.]